MGRASSTEDKPCPLVDYLRNQNINSTLSRKLIFFEKMSKSEKLTLKSLILSLLCLFSCSVAFAQEEAEASAEEGERAAWRQALNDWAVKFEAGYTFQTGRRDRDELTLRTEAVRQLGRNNYRFIIQYLLSKLDGQTGTDRLTGNFRWRRDLSPRFFTQATTAYERDRVRLIDHRVEQNLSLGWRFLDRPQMKASLGPGLTGRYNKEQGVADDIDLLMTVFQDFSWDFSPNYRLEQEVVYSIDPDETDDYSVRLKAGLVGKLTESLNLSLRYELLFENLTAADVDRADHRFISTIGYQF